MNCSRLAGPIGADIEPMAYLGHKAHTIVEEQIGGQLYATPVAALALKLQVGPEASARNHVAGLK